MTKIYRGKSKYSFEKTIKWGLDNKVNKCQVQLTESSTNNNKILKRGDLPDR